MVIFLPFSAIAHWSSLTSAFLDSDMRKTSLKNHFSTVGSVMLCVQHFLLCFSSVQSLSHAQLFAHGLQHARPPCPSLTPRVDSNSCPLSRWCHPTISSSVVSFSSCPQSFPASGSFPVSQFYASGGNSIRFSASASVLPMNTQDWSPLGWTGGFTESYLWPRIGIWFYLP